MPSSPFLLNPELDLAVNKKIAFDEFSGKSKVSSKPHFTWYSSCWRDIPIKKQRSYLIVQDKNSTVFCWSFFFRNIKRILRNPEKTPTGIQQKSCRSSRWIIWIYLGFFFLEEMHLDSFAYCNSKGTKAIIHGNISCFCICSRTEAKIHYVPGAMCCACSRPPETHAQKCRMVSCQRQ